MRDWLVRRYYWCEKFGSQIWTAEKFAGKYTCMSNYPRLDIELLTTENMEEKIEE